MDGAEPSSAIGEGSPVPLPVPAVSLSAWQALRASADTFRPPLFARARTYRRTAAAHRTGTSRAIRFHPVLPDRPGSSHRSNLQTPISGSPCSPSGQRLVDRPHAMLDTPCRFCRTDGCFIRSVLPFPVAAHCRRYGTRSSNIDSSSVCSIYRADA